MTIYPGRGAWSKRGMPVNGTGFYQLLTPVNIGTETIDDLDHRAVKYGVKALQHRLNTMGYLPALIEDSHFGPTTAKAALWAQKKLGVVVDGQIGPKTATAMFWPSVGYICASRVTRIPGLGLSTLAHTVGGIAAHESMYYDPGAVGALDADDLGLVQINGPANPTMSEAARFDYGKAFAYCGNRITNAFKTYGNVKYAIADYANPSWAAQWFKTGIAPNPQVVAYVQFVTGWVPPVYP